MADLMVHEPLSLEELHAETGMMLPERDLMQRLTIIAGQANFAVGSVVAGVLVVVEDDDDNGAPA
jgi:hypothetical protein